MAMTRVSLWQAGAFYTRFLENQVFGVNCCPGPPSEDLRVSSYSAIFFIIEENLRRIPCKVDPNRPQCGPLPPI